ncbi:spore germination protein [Pseudogemmobacter blasticus]|nr:spore germination protein [Fuscovulum blasticum]
MTAAAPHRTFRLASTAAAMPMPAADLRVTCAVRLIDRRTGRSLRVNGSPLVLFTRRPDEAVAELLEGRDPAVWEARIEPLGREARR